MPRFTCYDPLGVARFYSQHPNIDVAETWAIDGIFKRMKIDRENGFNSGPFKDWKITKTKTLPFDVSELQKAKK